MAARTTPRLRLRAIEMGLAGLSQKEIVEETGLSRSTVNYIVSSAMASDDYVAEARRDARAEAEREERLSINPPIKVATRCGGCGGLIFERPCRLCRVRARARIMRGAKDDQG